MGHAPAAGGQGRQRAEPNARGTDHRAADDRRPRPLLVEAREIVAAFQAMVRTRSLDALEPWLERAGSSLAASFANGVLKDKAAVAAAITSPWSNGQTEGQITKLKLVKRQMYGRGKLDLLQARVIGAT